jgi:hypothetical protein
MTLYERLFDLKYRQGISTHELARLFPRHIDRINEVALLDIPEDTLKELVPEKRTLERLISLKKQLQGSA